MNALDKIEDMSKKLSKMTTFSPEERLIILREYSHALFLRSVETEFISPSGSTKTPSQVGVISKTFAEMLRETGIRQHPDIVLLAIYFLNIQNKLASVTVADIEGQYAQAMLKLSSNTNAMVNANRKKGFIQEAGEKKDSKKAFKMTLSGVSYVENFIVNDN